MASDLITRLDAWLRENRIDVYESLQPGADADVLVQMEADFGFRLPALFRELYMWRNGQQGQVPPSFRNNSYLMPIDEISHTWREMTSMQEHGEWEQPQWWSRGWVPFLHNGAGSNLCVDMLGSFTGRQGQVIEFWAKFGDRPIIAPDIDTWLRHFVETMEQGLWAKDGDGNFSPLDDKNLPQIPGYPVVGDSNQPLPE